MYSIIHNKMKEGVSLMDIRTDHLKKNYYSLLKFLILPHFLSLFQH